MRTITLMLKTFWSPGEVFAEIKESKIGPWIPMLTVAAFSVGLITVLLNVADVGAMALRAIMQSPQAGNMSQEDMENMRRLMNSDLITVWAYVNSVLFWPLWTFIVSTIYFGLFLILGSRGKFMQFWSVTAFSFMPMLIGSVAGFFVIFTTPPAALEMQRLAVLTAATFVPLEAGEFAGILYTFLQTLSLTTLWALALMVIGYGVIGSKRISAVTRTVVVCIPWLLTVSARIGIAWIFS